MLFFPGSLFCVVNILPMCIVALLMLLSAVITLGIVSVTHAYIWMLVPG